jgi:hypothetical protein
METLHSLEGCYSEINMISDVEGEVTTLGVSVTLLTGLGSFETFTNKLNLLFSFSEGIWSEQFALSGIGPIQGCTTLLAVKGFKRGHLQTRLITVVVRELCKRKTIFPLGTIG